MNSNNSNKLSEIYSRIFKGYLYFSPYFRRNCIELKDIYKWLKALNLSSFNYPDFCILMEWFNALNLIKPLFIVHFPKEHSHHIYFNQAETLSNDMRDLIKLYNDGLVIFPEEIYDNEAKIKSKVKPWQHEKIEHQIKTKLKGTSESDPQEEKIAVEETKYFYHPIQFFQILTYLRGYSYRNLYQHKSYKKFYWERRFNFDDYMIKRLKQKLNEDKESIEDFIQEKLSKGISFNQFDRIFFEQNRWLIEKSLFLWIKIESLFHHYFYKPSFGPNIRLDYQLPIQIRYNRKKSKEEVENHYKWLDKVRNTLSNYFTGEDFNLIREFRQRIEIHSRIDGLENFIDLFLYIDSEKKEKLKGYLSYYVNIIDIVRTLKLMENELIKAYPSLAKFKIDPKWYEPRYFFDIGEKKEEIKYKTKLLLDYGLTQEETFIIFVEGPTEMKLLEDWVKRVLYRTGIKISLKPLRGKKKSNIFEYLVKEFEASDYFLIMDADTYKYMAGKKGDLKDKGIDKDAYFIFFPDFVTANFGVEEIIEAFENFFEDFKNKIEEKSKQKVNLVNKDKEELLEKLNNKTKEEKFEAIIEEFLKIKLNNPNYKLKKIQYAEHLATVLRKNLLLGVKRYPFEEILGKFVKKIQKKQFPDLDF